jgi:hypothetical protein
MAKEVPNKIYFTQIAESLSAGFIYLMGKSVHSRFALFLFQEADEKVKDGRTAAGRVDPSISVSYGLTALYLSYSHGRDILSKQFFQTKHLWGAP